MDISKERFGRLLIGRIKENKWSQREFATRMGYSASVVSHIRSGDSLPTMEAFFKMCSIFGCTPDEFLELPGTDRKVKIIEVEAPRPEAETTEWLKDDEGIWFCRRCRSDAPYDRTGFQRRTKVCPFCGRTVKHPIKKEEKVD